MPEERSPPQSLDQDRMELVEKISQLVHVADHDTILRLGMQAVVPELADIAVLATADDSEGEQLRVAHAESALQRWATERVRSVLPALRRAALRDQSKQRYFRWIPHVSNLSLQFLRDEPALVELLYDLQVRSLMVVPARAGARTLGVLALCRTHSLPFHAADLAIAQVLARRIASAVENAQLYERGIDEQRRHARLEAAVQKWVRVFDLAGWGAAIVDDTDHRIEVVNPAFAELHGYSNPADVNGRLYTDLLEPGHVQKVAEWVATPGTKIQPYESMHMRANGSAFPVLTDVTALEMGEGATSFVVTVQNLTELKRAEERLRRAQRLESVGRLAGGVAHEVNNMMTIILGFSDLLSRAPEFPSGRQREIEEIRKAASRAGKITQQLLAFSRQQILQPSVVQINDAINDLLPVLRLLMPANIELETSLAPLGPTANVDRAQLDQVIINLAFNGRDAMPDGGTLRLVTDSRRLTGGDGLRLIGIPILDGQYVLISIVDTGRGMDSATLQQLFEPFFTTKPLGLGTGLGLATVYGIVKQSAGYVWVDSSPGAGTTVTVCLPQVDREVPAPDVARVTSHPADCRQGTVLVIEDEPGVRELVHRVLEQQGHRILEAEDGAAALSQLSQYGPELDLVLSDVIIPGMSIRELEQRARELRPDLSIVFMSGYAREEMLERGLIQPDHSFLQKPFTGEELTALVCRGLEREVHSRGGEVAI